MAYRSAAVILISSALLAGCWSTDRPAVESAANAAPAGVPGSCAMTFGAVQPDATEGTIAPAGGCPYNFFTSRKWNYTTRVL